MQRTWINTIKAMAVCWAFLASVWLALRILRYLHSICKKWYYGRQSVSRYNPPQSPFAPGNQPVFDEDDWSHLDQQPPPEYRLFLPPSYDEVTTNTEKAKL